jgi:hypothetical protein
MFSETVRSILEANGWFSSRNVPTSNWESALESEGFTMLPSAISVLRSFGGLKIVPTRAPAGQFRVEILDFDPITAAEGEFDRVEYWQEDLNLTLSPIAELGGEAIVLLAEDGRVFSCWCDLLWLNGESFEDAVENSLILPKRPPIEFAKMRKFDSL